MDDDYYQSPASLDGGDDGLSAGDGSGRLKAMGVFQIVLGSFSALFALFTLIGVILSKELSQQLGRQTVAQPSLASMLSSLVFYLLASLFFFIVGFGSIKARRWVRPIVLAVNSTGGSLKELAPS